MDDTPYEPDRPLFPDEHVKSSAVRRLGYDKQTHVAQVEVHGGRIYHYFMVKPAEYRSLRAAASIGEYYGKTFKPQHRIVIKVRDPALVD
ncbi:MAG: KTSC domain-containing protein [Burkholderiales bacterium]|nr:KTSC domain-containing protein [Burkholderiales bacterium]